MLYCTSAYKSIQISKPCFFQAFNPAIQNWIDFLCALILWGILTFKVDLSLVGSFLTFPSVCSSTNWLLAFQSRAWYIFSEGIKSWKCYQKPTNLGQNCIANAWFTMIYIIHNNCLMFRLVLRSNYQYESILHIIFYI